MSNLHSQSWFDERDQEAFDLFAAEIHARKPQYAIEKTQDRCRHDAVVNGNIAVEIKTRWNDKQGRKITRNTILRSKSGPNIIMNNNKLKYLQRLTGNGFKQVFLAYFLADGFFLLDVSKLKILKVENMPVSNPGKGLRVEPIAHIDISAEPWYPRIAS